MGSGRSRTLPDSRRRQGLPAASPILYRFDLRGGPVSRLTAIFVSVPCPSRLRRTTAMVTPVCFVSRVPRRSKRYSRLARIATDRLQVRDERIELNASLLLTAITRHIAIVIVYGDGSKRGLNEIRV